MAYGVQSDDTLVQPLEGAIVRRRIAAEDLTSGQTVYINSSGYAALTATIAVGVGFALMSWMQGRAARMNAVATFVALLFFGWLWGPWGLVLGAPLMAVVKVCADRIEPLKPLGELIGE